jgi:hypothetical protein
VLGTQHWDGLVGTFNDRKPLRNENEIARCRNPIKAITRASNGIVVLLVTSEGMEALLE